jgi:hypothetical protein
VDFPPGQVSLPSPEIIFRYPNSAPNLILEKEQVVAK